MAMPRDDDLDEQADPHETQWGEVPEGLGADLYTRRLEQLRDEDAFGDAVLSFRDVDGHEREVAIEDVESTEAEGSSRTKIVLRNGAIVVATGAVIAGAIAAVRYRRRHKG